MTARVRVRGPRSLATGALTIALTACVVGSQVRTYPPAMDFAGAQCELRGDRLGSFLGELLAPGDTASLFVIGDGTLVSVPHRLIERGQCKPKGGDFSHDDNGVLGESSRKEALEFSRYRTPLTPELLATLLAAYKQYPLRIAGFAP